MGDRKIEYSMTMGSRVANEAARGKMSRAAIIPRMQARMISLRRRRTSERKASRMLLAKYQAADASELSDLPAVEVDAFIIQPNEGDKRRQTGPIEKKRAP